MKKFLSILLVGFIGFLGIFTTTSTTKISAEPKYFLQSERKNAIVYNENNQNIKIFLDPSLEYNTNYCKNKEILSYLDNSDNNNFYYFDLDKNKIAFDNIFNNQNSVISVYFSANNSDYTDSQIGFYTDNENSFKIFRDKYKQNYELYLNENFVDYILGFEFENTYGIEAGLDLNLINSYIGNITELPKDNTTIEQIGNIISNTTNWFVNIFIGLSDIFYSNGTLGIWGSVLFLGVAFTLITICLKWVISLIKGI